MMGPLSDGGLISQVWSSAEIGTPSPVSSLSLKANVMHRWDCRWSPHGPGRKGSCTQLFVCSRDFKKQLWLKIHGIKLCIFTVFQ